MKKYLLFLFFSLGFSSVLLSQEGEQSEDQSQDSAKAQVIQSAIVLDKDTLFLISANSSQYTAEERAGIINSRLEKIVLDPFFEADSIHIDTLNGVHIKYGKSLIMHVFDSDCSEAQDPYDRAGEYTRIMRSQIVELRKNIDLKEILIQIGLSLLTIVIAFFVIRYVNRFFKFLVGKAEMLRDTFQDGIKIRDYQLFNTNDVIRIISILINAIRILVLILIFYITLPIILQIFPWTKGIAEILFGFVINPAKAILKSVFNFIPNLFTIAIIAIIFRYIAKGVNFLASEIRTEKLKLKGFYPDWAVPTARIIKFFLYAFMLVMIWPYIPGSESDAFRGISVFLGLLVSIGSSSAISNIVSGLVITYMRPYKVGDRVKIGDVIGDVEEKNLLVTRIKTIKNEVITVPNAKILNNSSVNFSRSSENSTGLIVHSSVTIGYDVPWRKVHAMLIEAAIKTPMLEENPKPFVLQTGLDDFYVSYQINAYTKSPSKQALIYSDLHALIQDIFAKNDVEIMSPHYRAEREGSSTIPIREDLKKTNGK